MALPMDITTEIMPRSPLRYCVPVGPTTLPGHALNSSGGLPEPLPQQRGSGFLQQLAMAVPCYAVHSSRVAAARHTADRDQRGEWPTVSAEPFAAPAVDGFTVTPGQCERFEPEPATGEAR